jgi:YD repeat-containing protein
MKFCHNCRTFFTWITLFILLTTLCAAHAFGIWIEPYLKKVDTEDVKSIKIVKYSFTEGNWQEADVMTAEYNNAGNLIKEVRHTADGILQFEYYYSYNDKGEMIKVTGSRMRNEELVPYEYEYIYDQRGNQIKGIGYGANGTETSIYTARYDENDNFVEGIEYKDGLSVSKYVAEYEAGNNLIEESKYKVYRYKGSERYQLEYRHLFSYDSKNNLVTEKNYGNDGTLEYNYSYQYDDDNNLVEGISYAKDGSVLSRYSAEYDDNNNLVKSIHYGPEGKITSKHIARYDKNNHLIEESNCTESSTKIIYRAEYDEAGNLLEETHYSEYVIGATGLDYRYRYKYDSRNNRIEEIYYVFFQEENNWKPISRQVNEICYQK